MACSSLSSSPSDSTSGKGNEGAEEGSERKRNRATDEVDEGSKQDEAADDRGEEGGQCVSSLSITGSSFNTQTPLTLSQQGLTQVLGTVRMAPTMVTNVVRPIASTPIPIASKPVEGAVTLSSLPQDKKATLLIGASGTQQLPITAGGGYLSSSFCPCPDSVTPLGASGLITNLVLGAAHPVQLLATQPQTQTPLPVKQPQLHHSTYTSCLTPPIAQVQYILPAKCPSYPQVTHQQIVSLPTSAALANGVHSGVGIRESPGTRGETESNNWLKKNLS